MPFSEDKILWMLLLILHSSGKFSLKMYKLDRKSFLWFFHLHRELDLLNLRLTKHVFVFFHSMRGLGNRFWNSTWKVMVWSTEPHKVLKNKSSNFLVECLFPSLSNVDKNVSRWCTNSCCLFCSLRIRVSAFLHLFNTVSPPFDHKVSIFIIIIMLCIYLGCCWPPQSM